MYSTRLGPALAGSRRPKHKCRGRHPMRGIVKPLDHEVSVDWFRNQLYDCHKTTAPTGAYDFKWSYLHSEILSKLHTNSVSAEVRRNAAIDKMLDGEDKCKTLNQEGFFTGFTYSAERFNTVANIARDLISDILGDLDYSMFEYSKFSGGASTSRKRRHGDPYFKYNTSKGTPVHVTEGAFKYAYALIQQTPLWRDSNNCYLQIVPGNRVTTVPKKTEIDRVIAMEPDMNMSLQLAVGGHIRSKLRRIGVDLNDQSNNQVLALKGSRDGYLSTIDLSSASDSISYRLVQELLPIDWFSLLDDLRSPKGELPSGDFITWEKFSSMGNGYTFELETLIFYAITKAVIVYESRCNPKANFRKYTSPQYLNVYGDDIICHQTFAPSVISVLEKFGFLTNLEKTFITGPFKESCGKHYMSGIDVTPFYIRSAIDTPQRCVWLLNKLRRWSYDESLNICDPSTWSLWRTILKVYAPKRLRGGKDIDSNMAIAMPGPRRDALVAVSPRKKVNGAAAILRSFQLMNTLALDKTKTGSSSLKNMTVSHVAWIDPYSVSELVRYGNSLPGKSLRHAELIIPTPNLYRYKPNKEPWRAIPLYPKEYK